MARKRCAVVLLLFNMDFLIMLCPFEFLCSYNTECNLHGISGVHPAFSVHVSLGSLFNGLQAPCLLFLFSFHGAPTPTCFIYIRKLAC
jgi:hypothetical protein